MENWIRNIIFLIGLAVISSYFLAGRPSFVNVLETGGGAIPLIIFVLIFIFSIKKSLEKQGVNFKDKNWQQVLKESLEAQSSINRKAKK